MVKTVLAITIRYLALKGVNSTIVEMKIVILAPIQQ